MNYIFILFLLFPIVVSCAEKQVYIVNFGEHKGEKAVHLIEEYHYSHLSSVKETEEEARKSLLYSYKHSLNGFAAVLTPDEASRLSQLEDVVSVHKTTPLKLHTTRSWNFLGLDQTDEAGEGENFNDERFRLGRELLEKAKYGQDIIVGMIDSGVWPESKSFSDNDMGPIPTSWKGICQTGVAFNSSHCNRKIIGARYYLNGFSNQFGPPNPKDDFLSPRDPNGHGTHTASTVAGRHVPDAAALGGLAHGTASGGAPLARLAIYKVCWSVPNQEKGNGNSCFMEDVMAAIDDAIADGVHVLSISIGMANKVPYADDPIAAATLIAVKKNIVVVCSAGNDGPSYWTASNTAPWIMTVGASSTDRLLFAPVLLGNGEQITGQSITPYKLNGMYPLVYAGDVAGYGVSRKNAEKCLPDTLSPELVEDKIVLSITSGEILEQGLEVKEAGGVGLILGNNADLGDTVLLEPHFLPSTMVTADSTVRILNYIRQSWFPVAMIQPIQTILDYKPAPFMASFSSRGPNLIDPNILKPDITAPGMNILAAWSRNNSASQMSNDQRLVDYNFDSGTSMSCPHVSAASVLLKAIHPNWSSAAIRSALMTTATMMNNMNQPITDSSGVTADPFQYGSGHFQPIKAADPGLVYDASYEDYLLYLCNFGTQFKFFELNCPNHQVPSPPNLNYPSLAIPNLGSGVSIERTLTNVGMENERTEYYFYVNPPRGTWVSVSPKTLVFDYVGHKKSFTLRVSPRRDIVDDGVERGDYAFGWYTWTDGLHNVTSPIAISLA